MLWKENLKSAFSTASRLERKCYMLTSCDINKLKARNIGRLYAVSIMYTESKHTFFEIWEGTENLLNQYNLRWHGYGYLESSSRRFFVLKYARTQISRNWNFFNSNDQRLRLNDGHWWLKWWNLIRLFNLLRYYSQQYGKQILNSLKKAAWNHQLNTQHAQLTTRTLNYATQDWKRKWNMFYKFYPTRLESVLQF